MHVIDLRLNTLSLVLPTPPQPAGQYRVTLQSDKLLFLSGQFPFANGKLMYCGAVGHDLSLEEGQAAAKLAALNVLAHIRVVTSNWQNFGELVRVDGYVSSAAGFYEQPKVLDGASSLFAEILRDRAGHVRTAFSVSQLPLNAAIELVVIATCCDAAQVHTPVSS